jgi:predicted metal-dependent phosphoesterase TrpH
MFLADFHVHTNKSDGKMNLPDVIDLFGKRGFGAIAVTDHLCENKTILGKASRYLKCSLTEENFSAHMDDIQREGERAWKEYGMLVIPGFEITKNTITNSRSAHLLALGIDQYINPNLGIKELCTEIRQRGGLTIAAHPVSTRKLEKQTYYIWDRREELKKHFDAWEVASGPHLFEEVLHSGLPMIANSDLHHPKQITSWKTVLRCEKNMPAILTAIREQDLSFAFYRDTENASAFSQVFAKAFSPSPWAR